MVDADVVLRSFVAHGAESDFSLIEGNRGLFDGRDVSGTHSTAQLAKLLQAPVTLVVNAAKSTRTVAAIVKGCAEFDPDVDVAGVILNRVAGERHLRVLRDSISEYSGLPVLGAIPSQGDDPALIPGRHLGLVPPSEFEPAAALQSRLLEIAERYLDVDAMIELAAAAPPLSCALPESLAEPGQTVRIAYFRDSVFTFYYPENLEALEARGARLVPVSSLADAGLPEVDALYIGGGFPETHAEELARNRPMMESVKKEALKGLPIYAECGGLIYLARSLRHDDVVYPMAGLFPLDLRMHRKPVGHGYTSVRVDGPNPFYEAGLAIRGHEFHYSGPSEGLEEVESCMTVETGVGVGGGRDGLVRRNTLACYTHVHASGLKSWASAMVSRAAEYARSRGGHGTENNSTDGWFESEAV
jgi:cobyrinic acid a,c-diamide synthase